MSIDNSDNTCSIDSEPDDLKPPPRKKRKLHHIHHQATETFVSIKERLEEIESESERVTTFEDFAAAQNHLQQLQDHSFSKLNTLIEQHQFYIDETESKCVDIAASISKLQERLQKHKSELVGARDKYSNITAFKKKLQDKQQVIESNLDGEVLAELMSDYERWCDVEIQDFLINHVLSTLPQYETHVATIQKFDMNKFPQNYPTTWKIYSLIMMLGLSTSSIEAVEKCLRDHQIFCTKMI